MTLILLSLKLFSQWWLLFRLFNLGYSQQAQIFRRLPLSVHTHELKHTQDRIRMHLKQKDESIGP